MIARGFRGPGGTNPMLLLALGLLVLYFLTGSLQSPIQNAARDPIAFLAFIIAIILGITVHEFMHAYAAHQLGDDTGRLMGRMTLNPLAHFDLFGTLLLVVAGFGYGKPVPFNESRLRSSSSVAFVALAGPAANFVIAALCAIPLRFGAADPFGGAYTEILAYVVYFNCVLGIFNLVPIPPLDGSNVVYGLLPPRQQYSWRQFQQYGPMLLLLLLFFGGRLLFQIVFGPAQSLANLLVGTRLF
ncbi:MAG: site-2 protease family protein [Chloroflexota bacterium]|nr:site-2 protease family protein [Chloroflexota bacterium]